MNTTKVDTNAAISNNTTVVTESNVDETQKNESDGEEHGEIIDYQFRKLNKKSNLNKKTSFLLFMI